MGKFYSELDEALISYATGKTSSHRAERLIERQLRQGCGDHGCYFKKPTGIGTNGGCRCVGNLIGHALHVVKTSR